MSSTSTIRPLTRTSNEGSVRNLIPASARIRSEVSSAKRGEFTEIPVPWRGLGSSWRIWSISNG